MFCGKCGNECAENDQFCNNCGASLNGTFSAAPVNAVNQKFVNAFSDNMFFVSCIMTTVIAGIGLACKQINLFFILFSIFMWLVYTKAKKGLSNPQHMRSISGTIFAMTVCMWVVVGILGFLAVIFIAVFRSAEYAEIIQELMDNNKFAELQLKLDIELDMFMRIINWVVPIILIAAAVVVTLFNILVYIPAHKLAKSMYMSAQSGIIELKRLSYIKVCLLVLGILYAIWAVRCLGGSLLQFAEYACFSANSIVLSFWLKNNFEKIESI